MKQKLMDKFPGTLSDSLSPITMKTVDSNMHILYGHERYTSQEVVARRIPLRYKPQTDIIGEDLINKNVITKVDKATKPDGVRMSTCLSLLGSSVMLFSPFSLIAPLGLI